MLFNNTNMRTAMAYTNAVGDKVYPVIVDIKKGIKSTEEILFVSSDINTGVLSVAFIQGNDTYNVEGAEVICSIMRPDTTTLEIPCNIINGNTIEVPLGVNGTSQDGVYSFDFKVFKGGNKIVGTPIMNYSVSLSISNDLVVEEDDRLPVLTMLMTQVSELHDRTDEAVVKANTATEATKVATANAIEVTNKANETVAKVTQDTANAIAEVNATADTMVENVNGAISSMDTTVNDKISEMTDAVNNKISEVDTAKNDMINDVSSTKANMVNEVTNAKNEMTATVTNKVNEVEGRFNALTASQQQSSEVIDARDGEVSLKARLDRDVEKANKELDKIKKLEESTVSTVTTESDFTTVEATSNGYFEDVKLEGKTLVNLYNKSCKYTTTGVGNYVKENNGVTVNNTSENGEYYILLNDSINVNPNTLYTLIIDIETSNNYQIYTWLDNSFKLFGDGNSNTKFAKTFTSGKESTKFRFDSDTLGGTVKFKNITILEGDHTQNPPSYFEGLMSVGQDVDKIEVLSNSANLFDGELELGSLNNATGTVSPDTNCVRSKNFIPIYNISDIVVSNDKNYANYVYEYDKDKAFIKYTVNTGIAIIKLQSNTRYIKIRSIVGAVQNDLTVNYMINTGTTQKNFVEMSQNKKQILFYNENGELEPIQELHEWDSIEKHSDNKWYYHKRSGKVVLNGSEEWTMPTNIPQSNTIAFITTVTIGRKPDILNIICDKFNTVDVYNKDEEGIRGYTSTSNVLIRISKSKLSTQDVTGFKQWLQANNVTVVYQLAQEEVYELAPLHLDSYANETLILCNSGAISPKMEFSITSHINELVKSQGDRISLLEEKMYKALKQVLAGDMYSLAELLYPEDFVEENPENEIMLLPFE